uniref:Uncharacterized protein n=1 Tax=Candidatus Kentrum sp. TC TaxID=2126339 RepID=A0A450Y9M8_9GAMM|nr:MAG: hypothetical protein BECKTC1821E_GA0114239_100211 [Candidatus Kentron sp. TC]VFK53121.1 MAG: hypothetical protein BECKTC1821F_GA0114240_100211 [Candidatus Kentron sp. TC]
MRVDLRGSNRLMSEEFLDIAHVQAGVEEVGSAGMAKHVGGGAAGESGVFSGLGDEAPDELGSGGVAPGVDEEAWVIRGEGRAMVEVVA